MGATRCTTGENDAIISAVEPGTRRSCAAALAESATATIKPVRAATGCRIRIMFSKSPANGRDITAQPGQLKAGHGEPRGEDSPPDGSYARLVVHIEFSNRRVIVA